VRRGGRLVIRVNGSFQVSVGRFFCQVAVGVDATDIFWVLAALVITQDEAGTAGALISTAILQR
jgi:hypothetical protein